ncbi:unnamed protein product [Mycena citricolor]|uniref:SWI/SNF and RSC complexes subunit Ssr4 N-terminal domain-containing protein n=1 Tax=Mycena citricolor TaxID=2018698 RepID=A0AAD2GRG2_9AGAR|nr:unnamed protein product [Mycena citricolor]CAK5275413.1 unnamed protein product [Mycena citricolor]
MSLPAAPDAPCLRFPENLGIARDLTLESAVNYLTRGFQTSLNVPYVWGYIDKPQEGQLLLVFIPPNGPPFPNDGLRYQDAETKYTMPAGSGRELEISETKFGYIPGMDSMQGAWRLRRRYRMLKGGHPGLVLVHYTRGPNAPIAPMYMNQPARAYPLRPVNEPAVYILGEKVGTKVFPPGHPNAGAIVGPGPGPGMGGNFNSPQAMLAQQNNNMAMMERRREQEQRARGQSNARRPPVEEEDSGDENDTISTRTLSSTRYRRNHDFMAEVFTFAAYNLKNQDPPPPPFSIFDKADLDARAEKLKAEIAALQNRDLRSATGADVSMQGAYD